MNIMEHVYLNFFTIGALIPSLFMGLLAYFFIAIKTKSRASVYFSRFLVICSVFFLCYVASAMFYHPLAAYHRWGTVATVIFGMVSMALAILNFPDTRFVKLEKIYLVFWIIVIALMGSFFFYESYHSEKIFHFTGHYWDFHADRSSKIFGLFLVLSIFLIMVMGVLRAVVNRGVERWAALFMGVIISCAFLIPGVLNLLSRDGLIDRGTYQISQNLSTITGMFIGTIIYLNVTKDRSNFLSKILIVSLATLLILVQGFSYFSLQDQERSFDQLMVKDARMIILTNEYPESLNYMISFSGSDGEISDRYIRDTAASNLDFKKYRLEYHNTLIYEKIGSLSKNNFSEGLSSIFDKTDTGFAGYKQAILQYASEIADAEENPQKVLISRIDSIERSVLFTRTKISQIPDLNFAEDLIAFLPKARYKEFNDIINKHVKASDPKNENLKKEILEYFTPIRASGTRIYRKDAADKSHYVSVMEVDLKENKVVEVGFPYLNYRIYVHDTSKKYIVMLIVMVFVIFAGFPVFFWGSLVKPVRNLLSGLREMQKGNLKVQIPVKVEDEFGFMARNFNTMADKIRAATENLEDKVKARTEELQAAMEEMEAMNEQLIEARDALWGEMELAKKIQMKLLPEDPAIVDYEITAYMQPADEVGGDYYDIINVAGMDWVVIGDVSGHGVPAGLVMMMTQTAIHVALDQNPDIAPDTLLDIVNNTITKNIKRLGEDKYMTITVLAASKGGKFIFSGLHQDIMIYRAATGNVDIVETHGMWIGIVDDLKGMLEVENLALEPGDVMLLYSDGITEARKKDSVEGVDTEEFGDKRLYDFFKSRANLPVEEIKSSLLQELDEYRCGDDVTMVILRRKV